MKTKLIKHTEEWDHLKSINIIVFYHSKYNLLQQYLLIF